MLTLDPAGSGRVYTDDQINATFAQVNQIWDQVCVNFYPFGGTPPTSTSVPATAWNAIANIDVQPDLLTSPAVTQDMLEQIQRLDSSTDYIAVYFRQLESTSRRYGVATRQGAALLVGARQATSDSLSVSVAGAVLAHELGHVMGLQKNDLYGQVIGNSSVLGTIETRGEIDPRYVDCFLIGGALNCVAGDHAYNVKSLMTRYASSQGRDISGGERMHLVRFHDEF